MVCGRAPAQVFTTLHSFTALSVPNTGTNVDGRNPGISILSGNTLFGVASQGGVGNAGTVYAVNTDGSGFTVVHNFTALSVIATGTNGDGGLPVNLILSGNTLYGATSSGGSGGNGTIFSVNTNGTGFTVLHSFTALSVPNTGTNADGAKPGFLQLAGANLYGTTSKGGSGGNGTIFSINTNGTGFTNLHVFAFGTNSFFGTITNADGSGPASLMLSGNTLYGATRSGGSSANGTVFAINTSGAGFTNLHIFTAGTNAYPNIGTNSDGALPSISVLSGTSLYGTTQYGGSGGNGTVFVINTSGGGFTNLHVFAFGTNSIYGFATNSDGAAPGGLLILSGNTLYGTTTSGGSSANGTVFAVNTSGTGFTNLHIFTAGTNAYPNIGTNSDGALPTISPVSSNVLYGTTSKGGRGGNGTVFAINPSGATFTNLHDFGPGSSVTNSDGMSPMIYSLSSNILYGIASSGGYSANGTVFSLSSGAAVGTISVPIVVTRSGNKLVLTWTNASYLLQSAPLVTGTYTNINGATSPFTNLITGPLKFFRLVQ